MKNSLLTASIEKIDLYVAGKEMYIYYHLVSHIRQGYMNI